MSSIQPATQTDVARAGFQLVQGDIELLSHLFHLRLARIDHLAALTERSYKKAHERLLKLHEHGYVSRISLPLQKHIYALAKRGQEAFTKVYSVESQIKPRIALLGQYVNQPISPHARVS